MNVYIHRTITLSIFILAFSGCSSTTPKDEEGLSLKLNQQIIKEKLESHVEDYQQTKPAIERLVALESDLRLLVTQIANFQNDDSQQVADIDDNEKPMLDKPKPITVTKNTLPNEVDDQVNSPENITQQPEEPVVVNVSEIPAIKPIEDVVVQKVAIASGIIPPTPPKAILLSGNTKKSNSTEGRKDLGGEQLSITSKDVIRGLVTQCPPKSVESDITKFGVHVSSFKEAKFLVKAWDDAAKKYPTVCLKGAVVKEVKVKKQTFHSLRIGPYENKENAKTFCRLIRSNKQYCRVTDFSGTSL